MTHVDDLIRPLRSLSLWHLLSISMPLRYPWKFPNPLAVVENPPQPDPYIVLQSNLLSATKPTSIRIIIACRFVVSFIHWSQAQSIALLLPQRIFPAINESSIHPVQINLIICISSHQSPSPALGILQTLRKILRIYYTRWFSDQIRFWGRCPTPCHLINQFVVGAACE